MILFIKAPTFGPGGGPLVQDSKRGSGLACFLAPGLFPSVSHQRTLTLELSQHALHHTQVRGMVDAT
jgi:hypothetical protein